jgi:hypothetical protein
MWAQGYIEAMLNNKALAAVADPRLSYLPNECQVRLNIGRKTFDKTSTTISELLKTAASVQAELRVHICTLLLLNTSRKLASHCNSASRKL